jgi:CO/xanthine dehydrogenase FAD-binding subunit
VDLGTIEELVSGPRPADWRPGDAWLAGGTWLFSEPQPHLRRLLDLTSLGWPPLQVEGDRLVIAATCTIAELYGYRPPADWSAAPLIGQCCEAFLASFKIWNEATVGGNLCNSLPAGPMISLTAALDGVCRIVGPDRERTCSVTEFITGDSANVLGPGELLRSIAIPFGALRGRTAFRQVSLSTLGRSAALLIGRRESEGLVLIVTASTKRPLRLRFDPYPSAAEVAQAVDEIPAELYHDDVHGLPAWRRHLTFRLAGQIRAELEEGP